MGWSPRSIFTKANLPIRPDPVATVTEIDPLKVAVYLPANAYPLVSVGARARVTPKETSTNAREAVVATKDPQIDASSGLFLVQLRMPNPNADIPAGVRCNIEFLPPPALDGDLSGSQKK